MKTAPIYLSLLARHILHENKYELGTVNHMLLLPILDLILVAFSYSMLEWFLA